MSSNRFYYFVKPYIPWRLRMWVRQSLARRQRESHQDVWPINEAAGRPPAGWPGWPEGKKFAFVLTHDVEGPSGLAKCRQLMELEKGLGFHSSFNFIPEGDYAVSRELRQELAQSGFEVGVHDLHHDGKLYQSREGFVGKARRINEYLSQWGAGGFRGGFMLRRLDWIHDLHIQYDASTFDTDPFEPQPDGAGTIFPFWIPRPEVDGPGIEDTVSKTVGTKPAASGYVELPYTLAQDSTMFFVLAESSPAIWKKKLDWIVGRGGMALLNVHPDYLRFPGEPAAASTFPVEFYREFLQYLKDKHGQVVWHALPREVAAFVRANRDRPAAADGEAAGTVRQGQVCLSELAEPVVARASLSTPAPVARPVAGAENLAVPPPAAAGNNGSGAPAVDKRRRLRGRRVAVVLFSDYPGDPRPKRSSEALAQEGAEVELICLQDNPEEPRRETVNGVRIFRVPLKHERGGKLGYVYEYSAFLLAAFIFLTVRSLKRRFDLVHVHNMPDVLVFSALVPKAMGARVILDMHDPMPELMTTIFNLGPEKPLVRILQRTEKWSMRFADLVLTPNIAFKKLFITRSCPPEKIHILMNCPNEKIFPFEPVSSVLPERKASDPFVILYHGSLVARHGLDLAIDAMEQVRKSIPNVSFVICGKSTPYLEEVMKTVAQRGLQPAVRYLGLRNRQQIVDAIRQCDLGIIPNRRSVFTEINMPTRIFEYLALAKPVIAPATRGIQDYFSGQELLFFEPDNVADLAEKIQYVALHPQSVQETVRRGQAVYQRHTWKEESSRFLGLAGGLMPPINVEPKANAENPAVLKS